MSHCICLLVAPVAAASRISEHWPELPRLDREDGYSLFPVDAELIDAKISPDKTPQESGNEFMLLTHRFRQLLQLLSEGGELAYVETEYWAGVGGQGALVCRDGHEIMAPTWSESGTINEALMLIGVQRGRFADRFDAVGLADVRGNDDLLELIAAQSRRKEA
jgi:hypothetical protein